MQPSTSPGLKGLVCGTTSAGKRFASFPRTSWMALANWMVPASTSAAPSSKLANTQSTRCCVSNAMSTNTYRQGKPVTSTGTRHEWP